MWHILKSNQQEEKDNRMGTETLDLCVHHVPFIPVASRWKDGKTGLTVGMVRGSYAVLWTILIGDNLTVTTHNTFFF